MKHSFKTILLDAHATAAMAVQVASIKFDESKGGCGFAWVTIDGNEPLARYCRAELKALVATRIDGKRAPGEVSLGDKGYPKGWQFWNPGNHGGQRVDIKEAGAKAFRDKLAQYGIRADVGSRLD